MFKVVIIGAENRGDYRLFAEKTIFMLKNKAKEGIKILSTGDNYIKAFAKAANIDVQIFQCEWGLYGKDSIKIRNEKMLTSCDAALVFDDGTKDTKMFLKMAIEHNIPYRIIK